MKKFIISILAMVGIVSGLGAQTPANMTTIKLNAPNLKRGVNIMEALSKRQSTRTASAKELSTQDLSDLMWAANGINRPDKGLRTAPSAMNKQDVKLYVCTKDGSYFFDHKAPALVPVSSGDVRPTKDFPVVVMLVTDTDGKTPAMDAGIVSQNISLFCSGVGMVTYPRGMMDKGVISTALKLKDPQTLMLCHPVGFPK